ncbi:hypothetical protein FRC02_003208, partial [Tulasnella sp. 418]
RHQDLKKLNSDSSSKSSLKRSHINQQLRCEVNIWSRLTHPNVVPLLGVSTLFDELPSLISPWYANGSLTSYLSDFPQVDRLCILCDLSDGLGYLHSLDIVHGDVKPDNVLVDSEGRACWCDFGISHFVEGATGYTGLTLSTTFRGGTAPYMSPEQVESDGEGRKTTMMDIWAFGCLMAR